MGTCQVCETRLYGRQRKFCSQRCKNLDTNNRHQNYAAQQVRGRNRKLVLMRERGMRCAHCGYGANHAAMAWHHKDAREKSFELSLRSFSNRSMSALRSEAAKCSLLCANCHAEVHFPHCGLPPDTAQAPTSNSAAAPRVAESGAA